jgi:hypothetical protein
VVLDLIGVGGTDDDARLEIPRLTVSHGCCAGGVPRRAQRAEARGHGRDRGTKCSMTANGDLDGGVMKRAAAFG